MNTMISVLLVLGATLPDVTIDNTKLLYEEADWLVNARVRHYVDLKATMDAFAVTANKVTAEVAELTTDASALPDGAEKTAVLQQIATVEAGQAERAKIAAKEIKRATPPTPAKARKRTIDQVYNGTILNPATDANSNGTLSKSETGWPAWLFSLVDTDANNQLTPAEFTTYLATL